MPCATDLAASQGELFVDDLNRTPVVHVLAAVVHETVRIVPDDAPLLNLTVNESPKFNVKAEP